MPGKFSKNCKYAVRTGEKHKWQQKILFQIATARDKLAQLSLVCACMPKFRNVGALLQDARNVQMLANTVKKQLDPSANFALGNQE